MDFQYILSKIPLILTLIVLEGILSIDNAAVLAALARTLPQEAPAPRPFNRWPHIFGDEQQAALKVGILGAYLGRGLMLVLASLILAVPYLRSIGAAYLFYLVVKHFMQNGDEEGRKVNTTQFWVVVLNIELADLAFSFDNVAAAVALSTEIWVLFAGVFIGIAIMRFAATIFVVIMRRWPELQHGAYCLLVPIGLELVLKDFFNVETPDWLKFTISLVVLVGTVLVLRNPLVKRIQIAVLRRLRKEVFAPNIDTPIEEAFVESDPGNILIEEAAADTMPTSSANN